MAAPVIGFKYSIHWQWCFNGTKSNITHSHCTELYLCKDKKKPSKILYWNPVSYPWNHGYRHQNHFSCCITLVSILSDRFEVLSIAHRQKHYGSIGFLYQENIINHGYLCTISWELLGGKIAPTLAHFILEKSSYKTFSETAPRISFVTTTVWELSVHCT